MSFVPLAQVPAQGTSTIGVYVRIEGAAREECSGAQQGVLTEVPIGRVEPVPDPVNLPPPLAPAGSNEQDDPGALNQREPAAPKPSTQQDQGPPPGGTGPGHFSR